MRGAVVVCVGGGVVRERGRERGDSGPPPHGGSGGECEGLKKKQSTWESSRHDNHRTSLKEPATPTSATPTALPTPRLRLEALDDELGRLDEALGAVGHAPGLARGE